MLSLSEILASARIEAAGFALIHLSRDAKVVFERSWRVCLHYVLAGEALMNIDGAGYALKPGDFVCLHRNGRHALSGDLADKEQKSSVLRSLQPSDELPQIRFGRKGGEFAAELLSGAFRLDWNDGTPLLALMPDIAILRADHPSRCSLAPSPMIYSGCRGPGAGAFATTLMQALFFQAVRADVSDRPSQQVSDLSHFQEYSSLHDYKIAYALRLIHREFSKPWTVTAIAGRVGMSRSGFAQRFHDAVGVSPMARLAAVRLAEARKQLLNGVPVHTAALAVGYRSLAAFSRAFYRHYGEAPTAVQA